MIYFVDIDDTICTTPPGMDYRKAEPIRERIMLVNRLVEAGHQIVYWTARGTGTGIDWREITEQQLKTWGANYTELRFGKPVFDVLIDDRAFNVGEAFGEAGIGQVGEQA